MGQKGSRAVPNFHSYGVRTDITGVCNNSRFAVCPTRTLITEIKGPDQNQCHWLINFGAETHIIENVRDIAHILRERLTGLVM